MQVTSSNNRRSPNQIDLAIVVVNYHCTAEIKRLLGSIERSLSYCNAAENTLNLQVWIINNSPDDSSLSDLPYATKITVRLIQATGNIGFGRACNLAIAQLWKLSNRPWIWLLNPDTTLNSDTLQNWMALLGNHRNIPWAIAGTTVKNTDQNIEFSGGYWDPKTGEIYPLTTPTSVQSWQPILWASGCSLILNPDKFGEKTPQFDPDFFLYYEDFEFCRRYEKLLRSPENPYPIALLPSISVIHHTSSVTGRTPAKKTAWAIEGYLLALEKCVPRGVWLRRLVRIAIAAGLARLRGRSGKWIGIKRYFRRRFSQ
ncbi:MAG: glycosyltransferase family 2 protein [Cyanobacteria bacterium P01_D01_bin.73]